MSSDSGKIRKWATNELEGAARGKSANVSLEAYKRFRKIGEHRLRMVLSSGEGGREVVRRRAEQVDILLQRLYAQICTEQAGKPMIPGLAVIAYGGYGRREMNPYSDVDILFLHSEATMDELVSGVVQNVVRMLWDIGFKVGHVVASTKEVLVLANGDLKTKTSLLESRRVCGDVEVFKKFRQDFERKCIRKGRKDYVKWRLENQEETHERYGRIVPVQEPNIKYGIGGLRDYQNLLWVGIVHAGWDSMARLVENKILSESERRQLEAAYDFLLRVRSEVHIVNKGSTDVLTLHLQGQLAMRFGYTERHILRQVEAFMRDYYKHTKNIKRITENAMHRLVPQIKAAPVPLGFLGVLGRKARRTERFDGFFAKNGLLYAETTQTLSDDPKRLIRLFQYAQEKRLGLSHELRDMVRRHLGLVGRDFQHSREVREVFLGILSRKGEVGRVLRMMHDTDFLGRYLPEFGKLTCLVQHEFFHRYTADEHTLVCIEKLDALAATEDEKLKGYRTLFERCEDPSMLYLALLMHDTGKAELRRRHDEAGAVLTERMARRLHLSVEQQRTLCLLVDHHYLLSKTAQTRNLDDPTTILKFAESIPTLPLLESLMLITLADGQGTGDAGWSDWKEGLVWSLYRSTRSFLEEGDAYFEEFRVDMETLRHEVSRELDESFESEIAAHFVHMPERYFRTRDALEVVAHVRLFRKFFEVQARDDASALRPVVEWIHYPEGGYSEVRVCGWDRQGLFARICGAFLATRLNILGAEVLTRGDNLVLDLFHVTTPKGGYVENAQARRSFESLLGDSLQNPVLDFEPLIKNARLRLGYRMSQEVGMAPKVVVDSRNHPTFTIVEVVTPDRIGLLYDLFTVFVRRGVSLDVARIITEKEVAMDTFYVRRAGDGMKIEDENDLRDLQRDLEVSAAGGTSLRAEG